MSLGRFKLGDFVPLSVLTHGAGDIVYAPAAAPTAIVYDGDGVKVASFALPVVDKGAVTHLFVLPLRLDSTYAVGSYSVAINYTANSIKHLHVLHFEVVGGGDAAGSIISQVFYPRPHARFLVQKTSSFTRRLTKNPRGT